MQSQSAVTTFLFTDIEGSTRLWEQHGERMRETLACHDAMVRAAVTGHRGSIVKMSGDGVHAVFEDPLDALAAVLQLQHALADPAASGGVALHVRCGLHAGVAERRDGDFFGGAVNRAARITRAAHGGQVLLSEAMATLLADRLPEDVALNDLGAVRLRDLATSERVYQVVHAELRQEFPPLHSLDATPNNLPLQLTALVGRESELAQIGKLFARTRLLTLTGVGGLGKTRLSLQVAADAMESFPGGVWLVELAPLADAALVPQAVASVLGVKEEAGRPVSEALLKYVKGARVLIVLDNCEHLVHACAELARQLLQSGPHLKILASSREHLNVTGESTYSVPALATPDPRQILQPAALMQYASVRLFIDRAVAAQPAFELTHQNALAVAEICQRLDGIPLALELAAARVRALSVENIAAHLNDRFHLLTGGDRTAMPRQQTLRALIDWSYDLLTDHERILLRRLAVFAGGWTLAAAEAVGAGGDLAKNDVLDLLTCLVEKSLVVLESEGERYRLLETVRQYAQERLDRSDEGDAVRTRHLLFYLALAEEARPELVGPKQGAWFALLDFERENMLAAHGWADHAENGVESGLRFVFLSKLYWVYRGLLGLGYRMTKEALARPRQQYKKRTLNRCRALHTAGQLGFFMGHYAEAESHLHESLSIAKELDDKGRIAAVLQVLGMVEIAQNNLAGARAHLNEAVSLTQELGNKRELAAALNALAQLHRVEGELHAAEQLYENVLALAREIEDRESIATVLLNLAMVLIVRNGRDRARELLLEVLAIAKEIGSRRAGQSALEVSAGLAASQGEWGQAARLYGSTEAQTGETGLHRDPADEMFLAPLIARARAELGEHAFAAHSAAGRALSYDERMRELKEWLATRS